MARDLFTNDCIKLYFYFMRVYITGFLLILLLPTVTAQPVDTREIEIVRDSFGVPHIFAKTDAQAAYGLAWAQAEDDFKSLQLVALPAKGLMGTALGKQGAAGDYAFSLFRCREITEEKWHTLTPAFIKLAEAYVQALNNYALKHPEEVLVKKLFPITVKEYIASSVLALTVFNGADRVLGSIFSNTQPAAEEISNKGSNSLAVHPGKTENREAYLLVNAHQPNTGPQAFYEAHICSEEGLNVLGGLLAGGPCILHGVNEHLGWAHTVNYCDRLDVFQLEMNPANENQYKFDGQWVNLEKKKIKLTIKGIPFKIGRFVYWSKYGATMKNRTGYFSIRTGANMRIGALQQWYTMNKAKNFTEFYAALQPQELSMFNIMYADRYDTIFYINNALMPVRDSSNGFNWKKTLPGNTSRTLWNDFRNIKQLPQYINPGSGFLFNTNHSSFAATAGSYNLDADAFPKTDGWENYHNNRSKRLLELMPEGKMSFEQLRQLKFDKQLPARLYYPYTIDSMFSLPLAAYPEYSSLIETFSTWDKKGDTNSKGAAIFLLTYIHLAKKLAGQPPRAITRPEAVETFDVVKQYMMKHFGKTDITLGDLQKLVRGNVTRQQWGFPDLLSPQWTEPLKNGVLKSVGGDGYIMFIRFPKNSLPVIETVNMYGASSHPESKHFADQVNLYLNQQTKRMTLDKKEVYRNAERIYKPE
jgi:acyl-homoserine-lactone acylase